MNPLLRDEDVAFILYDVLDIASLTKLPYFADHGRETFDAYLANVARFAREVAFPTYRTMDRSPPKLEGGRVYLHPIVKELYPRIVELGIQNATRPTEVGGQQLPASIHAVASMYLAAGNLALVGFLPLSSGTGHLLEAFGSDDLKRRFMAPLYEGRWTGTMALTEPHAGSSLADVRTKAVPAGDGSYRISGSKIFISGGDQDITDNIVHLTLARIEGAPSGIKGVSLFAIPKKRDDYPERRSPRARRRKASATSAPVSREVSLSPILPEHEMRRPGARALDRDRAGRDALSIGRKGLYGPDSPDAVLGFVADAVERFGPAREPRTAWSSHLAAPRGAPPQT